MSFLSKKYTHTHFQAYFVCLLLANTMQAWGSTMSLKWVQLRGVVDGPFCAAQGPSRVILRSVLDSSLHNIGGLVQGGNIGAALWCVHGFYSDLCGPLMKLKVVHYLPAPVQPSVPAVQDAQSDLMGYCCLRVEFHFHRRVPRARGYPDRRQRPLFRYLPPIVRAIL